MEIKEQALPSSEAGRSRKRASNGKKNAVIGACAAGVLLLLCGSYAITARKYHTVFLPRTVINGQNVSGMTVEEVKQRVESGMRQYTLTLVGRQEVRDQITGADIGLHPEYDGSLERLLEEQSPLGWGLALFEDSTYFIETLTTYDEKLLEIALSSLDCTNPENMTEPEDAYLSDYIPGSGYTIIPETPGTVMEKDKFLAAVNEAIANLNSELSLEEAGVYREANVCADDEQLVKKAEAWNRCVNTVVTYRFGSRTEVLDGATIHTWLRDNGGAEPALEEESVAGYVAVLAKIYNTAYQPRELKTSYGSTVTIPGGSYGWRINQKEEKEVLSQLILSGESQTREPVYAQTAASREGADYGDTYVEINLTAQHLFFYRDGELLIESDFVSGNTSRGWGTPAGSFPLTYKQKNATLRGQNYATPVSYWMPFNGNIGMHDATWRASFGGSIYKTNGSHGCINLPPAAAKVIYENISAGMPVLCYKLDGTEQKAATQTKAPAANPAPAPTQPAIVETQAQAVEEIEAPVQPVLEPIDSSTVIEAGGNSDSGVRDGMAGPGGAQSVLTETPVLSAPADTPIGPGSAQKAPEEGSSSSAPMDVPGASGSAQPVLPASSAPVVSTDRPAGPGDAQPSPAETPVSSVPTDVPADSKTAQPTPTSTQPLSVPDRSVQQQPTPETPGAVIAVSAALNREHSGTAS